MTNDNRDELARLIREQLAAEGIGPEEAAKRIPEKTRRSFYHWMAGNASPRNQNRIELEEALGWERGSVKRILDASITEHISLGEVRDWSRVSPEVRPLARASEFSNAQLLMELTARFQAMEAEIEFLKAPSNVVRMSPADRPSSDRGPANLYDLAAHSTEAGRNLEHLEGDGED